MERRPNTDLQDAYEAWHIRRAAEGAPSGDGLHSWHRNVASKLEARSGDRILEVGCGRGEFARWLAARFPETVITAVDFSEAAIAIARNASGDEAPLLHFEVADASALRFETGAFDIVISCECIEHVPDPARMAREIHRVLRPGGKFFVTTENYFNGMILMWMKAWTTGTPIDTGSGTQPHENFFLFWRVRRMLERAGLHVAHMESDHFQWLMLPGVSPSTLCTKDFHSKSLKRLFRPFGRHFMFAGSRRG